MTTIIKLDSNWNLLSWSQWLDSVGVEIGRDYHWHWVKDDPGWAIEFVNPAAALLVSLRLPEHKIS